MVNNYEYIIASLPVPGSDSGAVDTGALLDFIRSQCSEKDVELLECLQDGFDPAKLDYGFYVKAGKSSNGFLREFLLYDLLLRDTKAEYLNRELDRPEGQDIVPLPGTADEYETQACPDYDEKPAVLAVLQQDDLLARERGLDKLLWDKADDLTRMHLFDMDVILAVAAKLLITERWNRLDPETGRELFRNLIQEIRNTRR